MRSNCETNELEYLLKKNTTINFNDTLHAKRFATSYLKSMYRVLDYSSINEDSLLYQTLFTVKEHHSVEEKHEIEGMQANLKFLAMATHKLPFLLTDENNNRMMRFFMSPSPKVHKQKKTKKERKKKKKEKKKVRKKEGKRKKRKKQ